MRYMLRLLQFIYVLYAAVLFLVLMIPAFLLSMLASLMGSIKGGNLIYRICTAWADTWFLLVGIIHRNIYEVPLREGVPYIFVANHISYLDAALLVKVFRKPMRPLGKIEMAGIPLFGYIYRKAIVVVDRSDPEKRNRSVDRLKAVLRKGISILVFPEGTFNETHRPLKSFYDGAFRIAIETSTPVKPVLFLDTYDRMPYDKALGLTPGKCRAVFLEEVPVAGLTTADVGALRERVYAIMEEGLKTYQASWIKEAV
jgi:1-acyl-sn-glycerol-3-phosphate acyltransferase